MLRSMKGPIIKIRHRQQEKQKQVSPFSLLNHRSLFLFPFCWEGEGESTSKKKTR